MCDKNSINVFLSIGYSTMGAAISLIVTAAILNNSFFFAPGSPLVMLGAAVVTGLATFFFSKAEEKMQDYFKCMGSNDNCNSILSSFNNAMTALKVALQVQTAACTAAAGMAWIPWVGAAPMYAIIAALVAQLGTAITLQWSANNLINCLNQGK